jgi:hypothetical protein
MKPGNPTFLIFAEGLIIQVSIANKYVVFKIHPLTPEEYQSILNY